MDVSKDQLIKSIVDSDETIRGLKRGVYKKDYYAFNSEVLGWPDIYEPLHRPLCEFVQEEVKRRNLLVELPRGTFKSSIVTVGYATWKIVNNPRIRILIANATYSMVTNFVGQIQDHLKKNKQLTDIYGDLSQGAEIWNENTIKLKTEFSYLAKENTLFGYGMQGNLVSSHFDLIILDDLVNWDNITTKDQIEKVIAFYKSCLDLLEPGGELIVIGTTYHYADLYSWIEDPRKSVRNSFEVFKKPAFEGEWGQGKLLFPDRLGWDRLKSLREAEGPSHFSSQYMLTPLLDEDATFKYDFKYYEDSDLQGVQLLHFMTIDPAISIEKEADQTAIVVVGVDKDNNWYIRDLVVGRFGPSELINQIMYMDEKWKPYKVGIEVVAFQKAIKSFLEEEVRREHKSPIPIEELKPETNRSGGSKELRIKSLEPRYAKGKVFHKKDLKYNDLLEDQLRRFPKAEHDDVIDALAYMEQLAFVPRSHNIRTEEEATTGKQYLY